MLRDPLALAASAVVLAIYGSVLAQMPTGAFWTPDEGAKFLQMRTVGWDGGLSYSIPYAGAALDPDFELYPTVCRHQDLYPVRVGDSVRFHWPIWFPLLTSGAVALFGLAGVFVIPLLAGWLTACLCGALVRRHQPRAAPVAVLVVGLASPVFFYSLTFWEHTLAALLSLAALAVASRDDSARPAPLLATGALLLGAIILRVEMFAFALALAIAWWWVRGGSTALPAWVRNRNRSAMVLASLGVLALLFLVSGSLTWRHQWLFGALPRYLLGDLAKLPRLPQILTSMLINSPAQQGPVVVFGWELAALIGFVGAAACFAFAGSTARLWAGLFALMLAIQFSAMLAFLPQPYVSLHSVLPVAPYLVAGLLVIPVLRSGNADSRLRMVAWASCLYVAISLAAIFTFSIETDGSYRTGLEWGGRYLFDIYPLFAVLALIGVSAQMTEKSRWAQMTLVALLIVALGVALQFQVRGLRMLHGSRATVASWREALRGPEPVLTNIWWLPAAVAPLFVEKPMHCVPDRERLSKWLATARAKGVDTYAFAGFQPIDRAWLAAGGLPAAPVAQREVAGLSIELFRLPPEGGP